MSTQGLSAGRSLATRRRYALLSPFEICSPERRLLAQQAFARIQPLADELGLLFYSRLFELDGALRELFKHDLANQAHALMTMLQP